MPSRPSTFGIVHFVVSLAVAVTPSLAWAAESDSAEATVGPLTFERDIRPILREHCLDCHGAVEEKEGSLDLRLVRRMLSGGDSGPAMVAGRPEESLMLQRIRDGEMPPGQSKLSAAELDVLERWVAAGAPTARPEPEAIGTGLSIVPEDRQWWSFQPIRRPALTTGAESLAVSHAKPEAAQARTPIDTLLLQAMPSGLGFSPDADRRSLIIRLYFDLIGLSPSADHIERFVNDRRPDAYERLVDELLSSPHYGERWGRHWLDVAGYADSEGRTTADALRPWAYQYRDYVIRSFNADKGLDRFIQEQIAGDELAGRIEGDLTPEQIESLTATGFMRMAADGTGSGDNSEEARNQVIADTIKIVSSSLLGLSFACAQCHDHRYDPILHTDYFALRAVFEPALDWKNWKTPPQRYVSLYTAADRLHAAEIEAEAQVVVAEREAKQKRYMAEALDKELAKYEEPLRAELRTAYETPGDQRSDAQKALLAKYPSVNITPGVLYQYNQAAADDLKKDADRIEAIRAKKKPEPFLRVLTEPAGQVPVTHLFHRGDHRQPKQIVPPAAPVVLCAEDAPVLFPVDDDKHPTTGRRLAFARWLTSDQNPITPRVMANRIWLHLMGRGLVQTPGDFGRLGSQPTHPELLDYLASELLQNGWSVKQLQRLIVTSTAYRQSSARNAAMDAIDVDNRYYWRSPVRRLDAEIVRDRLLATSGQLDYVPFGPATPIKEDDTGQVVADPSNVRRSMYIQQRRSQPVALMQAFDAPVMETNCEVRSSSTVATQSLMLMNSEFILAQAEALSSSIARSVDAGTSGLAGDFQGLPSLKLPPPTWRVGYGAFDETSSRTIAFHALPHFESGTWQGSARPDPVIGWVLLHASGGHTGNNPDFAAIRRWTAPVSGVVKITGSLSHASESGDGVRGRIVSSRSGSIWPCWATHCPINPRKGSDFGLSA
ncbi:MAG: PSD1 and planctomycete cytochrome C domain-containing protein, partial [Planctomycetaceae bacterium]